MGWKNIIGQHRVTDLLIASLGKNRLAHAYVFSGTAGIGKDAVAIELARVLNCERKGTEACGVCSDCRKFDSLSHPNLHLIFALPVGRGEGSGDPPLEKLPDDAIASVRKEIEAKARNPYYDIVVPRANTIKINSIRELRRSSSLTVYGKGKNVFIIMKAEQMNDESSNALLKTLEEPNDGTMLILTTSHPESLLPTILSRCQLIRFDPLTEQEIQDALSSREGVDSARAAVVARIANGSYARACGLLNQDVFERRAKAVDFLRTALYRKKRDVLDAIDAIGASYEKAEIEEMLDLLACWVRDAMALAAGLDTVVNVDDIDALRKFVAHAPGVDYPEVFRALNRSVSLIGKNVYIPLILLNLAVNLRKIVLPPQTHPVKASYASR